MKGLSSRQQRILEFIGRFYKDRRYPPTVREIVSSCGISSTSVADYNLNILEREGYIRRHPGISRGIELSAQDDLPGASVSIPLAGLIAAGEPIPVPESDVWDSTASAAG
jgi:repressor LexA